MHRNKATLDLTEAPEGRNAQAFSYGVFTQGKEWNDSSNRTTQPYLPTW